MARSKNVWGPYESAPKNPLLTNRGTNEYFQTVGHADLLQDQCGNWEEIPSHFVHWRPPPRREDIHRVVQHRGRSVFSLEASSANITGTENYKPTAGQTFMARKQTHTIFLFGIGADSDVLSKALQETGLSVFLTSYQHIDLSVVMLPDKRIRPLLNVQLRAESLGKPAFKPIKPVTMPLPGH
ncbi:hypothetical protein CEP54_015597 [Fusarium duplospermum]|uniref:Uncharacterized protein n=1 Tax=Fusarium duplospermum TaxID=1325734 RepID=A0A428NMY6_9HYPO|nr:hypothetical protein CEP54_015597 [Fusarium duplospermum]